MAMVLYDVSDGIATLTLNNPQERNSMTAEMVSEIVAAMDAAEADADVGFVIDAATGVWTFPVKKSASQVLCCGDGGAIANASAALFRERTQ